SIERHQRRKTVAPVGDVAQRLGVRNRIGVEHDQFRADGAGIGERQPDRKPGLCGEIVERMNHQRVVLLGDDDGGGITWYTRTIGWLRYVPSPLAGEG